jgi:plastocyanin|tara:strand:- start:18517 stop:26190 length:7674 start_codon:yes stop_codon:yes gene_type:complete
MASRIKLKRSLTPNSAPTTSDLRDKEVALNIVDRTLFVNNSGTIEEIANADPNDEKIVPSMFSSAITDGVGNTWYVSKNGTDKATLGSVNPRHGETTGANSWGKTPSTSFQTLKYALDNYAQSGDTIIIAAGTYDEIFPLTVPVGVTIKGDGLKSTFIKPTVPTNTEDAFLIEGDCNIEDLCVCDFYYDSVGDTGYAFRLKSTYTVAADGRRPYIQRCSVITKGSTTSGTDPRGYAAGDAGRGALVDGSSVAASSSEAALLFNECTFVVPNSVGLYLKNGARCEWLNSFTYFAADSIKGENPGGTGFKGTGKTRLKLNGTSGTFNATDTITYYDVDGVTVLASGTIESNDGTYIYIDGQGTGTFVEAEAQSAGKAVTANGDAQLDTDEKKFGIASLLLDGTGDYLSLAGSSDFGFGTGDFTVEAFIRPSSVASGTKVIADFRSTSGTVAGLLVLSGSVVEFQSANGAGSITGSTTLSANVFYHVAVVRQNGVTKLYLNGSQEGSNLTDTTDYGSSRALFIGANFNGSAEFPGHIDEFRVSKGLARYTTGFTPTTSEFVSDTNTQLLLHFNGLDGSTSILDGSISIQDIRSSSGGVAQYIALADYTDFGAELRSIGSASVYGERGITADGKGVRLRCIVHNFGYIGTGKDSSNDISTVNQANEIVEANSGRALFTSMDQNGDFRVGNAFFVDQENGTVSFVGGSQSGGTTFDQLVVTGTGDTTTILPTSISLGNLKLSGSTLETLSGNLVLDAPGGSSVQVDKRLLLSDGTYDVPSLAFTNDGNTGIARTQPLADGSFSLISNGSEKFRVAPDAVSSYTTANFVSVGIGTDQNDTALTSNGSAYPPGTFTNVPLIGGSGTGAAATITTEAFNGTITNNGSGYTTGTISNVALTTNGSGTGGVVDVTVTGIAGQITNGGSGYYDTSYNNVPLQGGNGTGAEASLTISGGVVTDVQFTNSGVGYGIGEVLTVNNSDLVYGDPPQQSGGSGFQFEIQADQEGYGPGIVTAISPVTGWVGIGYQAGDSIGLNTSPGSNFAYTLSSVGAITSYAITNSGADYAETDVVTPSISISPTNDSTNGILRTVDYYMSVVDTGGGTYVFTVADGPTATPVNNPTLNLLRNTVYNFIFQNGDDYTSYPLLFSTDSGNNIAYTALNNNLQDSSGVQLIIDAPTVTVEVAQDYPSGTMDLVLKDASTITAGATFTGGGLTNEVISAKSGNTISLTTQTGIASGLSVGDTLTVTNPTTLYYYSSSQPGMGNTATIGSVYGTGGQIRVDGLNDGQTTVITGANVNTTTIDVSGASNFGNTQVTGNLNVSNNATVNNVLTAGTLVANTVVNQSALQTTGNIIQTWSDDTDPANPVTVTNFAAKVDDPDFKYVTVNTDTSYFNFEVDGKTKVSNSAYLATLGTAKLGIGVEPTVDTNTTPATVGEIGEKVEILGNLKVTGTYKSSDGSVSAPEFTFQNDERLGIYSYNDGTENNFGITSSKGKIVSLNGATSTFHKNLQFDSSAIETFTLTNGSYYTTGITNDVVFEGGTGGGAIGNVTIAFGTTISNPGAGYTDAEYINVPLSYFVAPGGNVTGFTNLSGGSNYVDGTYTGVSLFGGGGIGLTADFTISGGAVTNVVVNSGGSGYANTDTGLTVDTANVGGSSLTTVNLGNGGSGYYDGSYTDLAITNVSSNGNSGTVDVTVSGGTVTNLTVNNGGGGYTATDQFTILPTLLTPTQSFTVGVTNNSASQYVLSGDFTGGNASITVTEGDTITFNVNVTGHPFKIVSQLGAGGSYDSTYDVASVNNNGAETGAVVFDTGAIDAGAGTYYYVCENHPTNMFGSITVNSATVGSGLAFTAGTVTTGSGFSVDIASTGSAGVQGTGATAYILVAGGVVTEFYVTDPGDENYQTGQTLFVADADMQYLDPFGTPTPSATPTTQFNVGVGNPGAITFVEITNPGNGYEVNDVLSLPSTFRPTTVDYADGLTVADGDYILGSNNIIYLVPSGGGGTLADPAPSHTTGSVANGTATLDFFSPVGIEFGLTISTLLTGNTIQIETGTGKITTQELEVTPGTALLNEVSVSGNTISRSTPGNLVVNSGVNGFVEFGGTDAIVLPRGTTAQRPSNQAGAIRFNSEEGIFEGNNGGSFVSLGGVRDVDLDTFIRPETAPGEDEDVLEFFAAGVTVQKMGETFLETNNVTQHRITDLKGVNLWVEGLVVTSPTDPVGFDSSTAIVDLDDTINFPSHSFVNGEEVTYANGGNTDLSNLVDGTSYYVYIVDADNIKLSSSIPNLNAGVYIDLTASAASELHTLTRVAPLDVLYYYGDNVYSVTGSGTFDADALNFPTHTTGVDTNGTATLTWVRDVFGDITVSGKIYSFTVEEFKINGSLSVTADNTTARIVAVNTNLDTQFRLSGVDETFIRNDNTGKFQVNTSFGSQSETFVNVFEYDLKKFTLADTRINSNEGTIDTSVGNSLNLILMEYDAINSAFPAKSGKVMFEIYDNATTPRRQYSEVSYLLRSDGSDVFYTESNKIYTDDLLVDVSVDVDASNNVVANIVDVTGSSTVVYNVKVVSQSILT